MNKTSEELEASVFKTSFGFLLGVIYGSTVSTLITISFVGVPEFSKFIEVLIP